MGRSSKRQAGVEGRAFEAEAPVVAAADGNHRAQLAALEAAASPIYIADADMRIQWVNRALTELTGYPLEEIQGRSTRFMREAAGDMTSFDDTRRTILAGKTWRGEISIRRKDGSVAHLEVTITPVPNEDGRIANVIGVAQDVTERRASVARLHTLVAALDAAANIVVITSRDGSIEWVNAAFVSHTGYSPEEVVGKTPRILKSGLQGEAFYRDLWDTILAGRVWRGELTNRRKDGTLYVQDETITPVRDAAGEIVRFVGVGEDVTQRHNLEAQLRQAQKMEAVGQLAGGIAHDFNNLLTTVLATSELLKEQLPPDSPLAEDVDAIAQAGRRGAELTRNLLAFSRRQQLEVRTVELTALIADFSRMIRRVVREDIGLHLALKESVWVRADPGAIEQILMNLTTNARDAMTTGGALTIEVGRQRLEAGSPVLNGSAEPGDYAVIAVRDNGVGMSEETRQRMFEPFFTTKPVGVGTGLGMAMVYGLVKQQGGVMAVESEIGKGTAVRLYLPVAPSVAAAAENAEAEAVRGGHETILLVEDEPAVAQAARRVLTKYGYRVLLVGDGASALETLARGDAAVDLVVTDVVMPRLGGAAMHERLREIGVTAPVLFTSGYAERELGASVQLPPDAPFLAKPWRVPDLLRKVREVLDAAAR